MYSDSEQVWQDAPLEMKRLPQWVLWKLEPPREPGGKPGKVPYNAYTGCRASIINPADWTCYEVASAALQNGQEPLTGLGFVFTENDPFVFIDLDGCFEDGNWSNIAAQNIYGILHPHTAIEVSQSRKGVHLIGRVNDKSALAARRSKFNFEFCGPDGLTHSTLVEMYLSKRFMALGGVGFDKEIPDVAIDQYIAQWAPEKSSGGETNVGSAGWPERHPDWAGPDDNDELLCRGRHMRKSIKAAFGAGASLADLLDNNVDVLAEAYPSQSGSSAVDESAADMALMNHLAFLTGKDGPRMVEIFSGTVRGQREKWQKRADYSDRTAKAAIASCTRVYHGNQADRTIVAGIKRASLPPAHGSDVAISVADGGLAKRAPRLTLEEMYKNFVFVDDGQEGYVADLATMTVRSIKRTVIFYAASMIEQPTGKLDGTGKLRTGANGNPETAIIPAFEIWLKDRQPELDRVVVSGVTWKPGAETICEMPDNQMKQGVNMYVAPRFESAPENHESWLLHFLRHIEFLIPEDGQRSRFLNWLAHAVQKPGELPTTGYIFVTKTKGVGRSIFTEMLCQLFPGNSADGVDLAKLLDGNFNEQLSQKVLITVNEIQDGMSGHQKHQRSQRLKSLITDRLRQINKKYETPYTEYNCARWILCTNHWNALPLEGGDRRFIVIENPRDKHPGGAEYYTTLHYVFNHPAFIASVRRYLMELNISDFNPGEDAPMSDAKAKMMSLVRSTEATGIGNFVEDWSTAITTFSDIKRYLSAHHERGYGKPFSDAAIKNACEEANLINLNRRFKFDGKNETLYFLARKHNAPTETEARDWPAQKLKEALEQGRAKMWNEAGLPGITAPIQSMTPGLGSVR
jgi:primase-polymerase (primpol)-like protein